MPRMSIYNVKTAVFPVAGRGTRFLPATKASPKEMLPIVDKPLIQYAAEEALSAGAENLVFITGSSKRAIEDHFDSDPELESALQEQGKQEALHRRTESPAARTGRDTRRAPSPPGWQGRLGRLFALYHRSDGRENLVKTVACLCFFTSAGDFGFQR